MRVTTNMLSENMLRQIQNLGSQQSKLQTQVATGQRIFLPEDDAPAVGRVLALETEQRALTQFQRNLDRALELSQASFGGLQQLKKISDRAGEIGTLGTGSLNPDANRAYASEVNQLLEQTLQFANTRFRNDYVFAGTAIDAAPFTATRDANGVITAAAYVGNSERAAVQISENSSITPGTPGATNAGIGDFINRLVALRDALNANDTAAIRTAQSDLITSEDLLVSSLAEHGGVQTRIEANRAQLLDRAQNLEQLVSGETDADLPTTIVRLNQSQTAYQAALQSAANIMRISLLDYIR
ncbi:MAG: flagellar hook-associated protein FlgL [Opitutaceae bacterium]|nr:flagellar hook-associated protein FlgL [Opitutaceae bacterium]